MKKRKVKQYKPYPESKLCDPFTRYEMHEVWGTLDGQMIPIKNLRDSHMKNIITHFEERGRSAPKVIIDEIERRKRLKLLKKSKAGKLLYGHKKA